MRVWDTTIRGKNVRLCNNLFLGSRVVDLVAFDSGGKDEGPVGPGNVQKLLRTWKLQNNWREGKPPTQGAWDKSRIPVE